MRYLTCCFSALKTQMVWGIVNLETSRWSEVTGYREFRAYGITGCLCADFSLGSRPCWIVALFTETFWIRHETKIRETISHQTEKYLFALCDHPVNSNLDRDGFTQYFGNDLERVFLGIKSSQIEVSSSL